MIFIIDFQDYMVALTTMTKYITINIATDGYLDQY